MNIALPAQPLLATYGQGIHDVPPEQYYRRVLGEANKSALDVVDRSLYHYRHWIDGAHMDTEEDEPDALRFGRAFHAGVLEPDTFSERWLVPPDFGPMQSSKNREALDAWKQRHIGCGFISERERRDIEAMGKAIRAHPAASAYLQGGQSEATVCWEDEETGLPCKARLDYWHPDFALPVDIKSGVNASEEAFARACYVRRYDVQNSQYCRGITSCGFEVERFMFIAVEKTWPHAVGVYFLGFPSVERGCERRRRNMLSLAEAMKTGRFPGYNNDQAAEIHMPPIAFYDRPETPVT